MFLYDYMDLGNRPCRPDPYCSFFITKWGSYGSGDGQFAWPSGIAVAPDGSVYVADTWNYRIQKFDSNGNFITKWGSYGTGDVEEIGTVLFISDAGVKEDGKGSKTEEFC